MFNEYLVIGVGLLLYHLLMPMRLFLVLRLIICMRRAAATLAAATTAGPKAALAATVAAPAAGVLSHRVKAPNLGSPFCNTCTGFG